MAGNTQGHAVFLPNQAVHFIPQVRMYNSLMMFCSRYLRVIYTERRVLTARCAPVLVLVAAPPKPGIHV